MTTTRATVPRSSADYGEAYSFMLFLYDRYGIGFMSTLHRDGNAQGLVGLQHALDGYANGADVYQVLHDFQVSTLVDKYVNTSKGKVNGIAESGTSKSLNSTVRSSWQPGVLRRCRGAASALTTSAYGRVVGSTWTARRSGR